MTAKIESEWREWYERAYGVRLGDPPIFDPYIHRSRTAYLAAASKRDEMGELERRVVETALVFEECGNRPANDGRRQEYYASKNALLSAVAALRAARQPAPVDHLQSALDKLRSIVSVSGGRVAEAMECIERAIKEREAK